MYLVERRSIADRSKVKQKIKDLCYSYHIMSVSMFYINVLALWIIHYIMIGKDSACVFLGWYVNIFYSITCKTDFDFIVYVHEVAHLSTNCIIPNNKPNYIPNNKPNYSHNNFMYAHVTKRTTNVYTVDQAMIFDCSIWLDYAVYGIALISTCPDWRHCSNLKLRVIGITVCSLIAL